MPNERLEKKMIEITEKTVGIWFLSLGEKSDWMCAVTEVVPDEKYEIKYRFCYYEDDKHFDSEDRKSWYSAAAEAKSRENVIAIVRGLANAMQAAFAHGVATEILNDGDLSAFTEKLLGMPFAYARQESAASI
jgi:hypothetical protein